MLHKVKDINFYTGSYQVIDPYFSGNWQRLELDLGCGKGGFSLGVAKQNSDTLVLAADIKAARLRKINRKAAVARIDNVETLRVLAWDLIAYLLPDNCIDRLHILNPDPWPKERHSANRLISSEFLGRLLKVLKPNAILHLSTDDEPYLQRMLKAIEPLTQYQLAPQGIDDVKHIKTEFEKMYLKEGKPVTHLSYLVKK